MNNNIKAIGPVIAITLLLIMAVFAAVSFQTWFGNYQTKVFTDTEQKGSADVFKTGIDSLIGDQLYFINGESEDINITEVEVVSADDTEPTGKSKRPCGITKVIGKGMHNLTLNVGCLNVTGQQKVDIIVHTNKKIHSKELFAKVNKGGAAVAPAGSVTAEGFSGGTGTLADPWQIENCSQLQLVGSYLTGNFTLNQNIDCNSFDAGDGKGFMPIGNCTIFSCTGSEIAFTGSFDGNGNNVQNLFINRSLNVALFSFIEGSNVIIKNFGVINVNITGEHIAAGLVGWGKDGKIENCYSTGNVVSQDYAGGLIGGFEYGLIDNSYSAVNIVATDVTSGGLVAKSIHSNISNSYATGEINAWAYTGGLVGHNYYGAIDNSYATGDVNGLNNLGGLVGYNYFGTIDNSYATGNVDGYYSGGNARGVGGLVGGSYVSVINNSYATGNITNTSFAVGGFIGDSDEDTIQNSYAIGNVNGDSEIGGFAGYVRAGPVTYTNTFSTGSVVGNTNVGGYIGENVGATIDTNSRWNNHTGNPDVAIGLDSNAQTVTAVTDDESYFYNSGNVPMSTWSGTIWTFSGSNYPTLS